MIYLDNAATTRVSAEVFEAMKPYFCEQYANPSAIYSFAGSAAKAVDEARRQSAALIGAQPNEIYFTAGGSESDMMASLRRLGALEENYNILPGHQGVSTLSREKKSNPYLREAMTP